ncbi:MAG: serine hydrolase [Anaerolineales bacterium]|nr:serine hydrolase [Anaerolineales bacterium]
MNQRNDPGFSQWLITVIVIAVGILLIYKLVEYSNVRNYMPTGLEIAGINVGGFSEDQVREVLTNRYLDAPVVLYHGANRFELNPLQDAEFELDFETMLAEAQFQREQQDYWAGFWGYLWGRPVEVNEVPLRATHNRDTLTRNLQLVATNYDLSPQPPQPVPQNLSFLYGEAGLQTDLAESLDDVEAALYRPTGREAYLVVEAVEPPRPNINLLANLIVNHLEGFDGVASIHIRDLQNGDEININTDLPMSGMSILKVPIVLETLRALDQPLNSQQADLVSEALLGSGNESANQLLNLIAGQDNPYLGADMTTEAMTKLGLENTFIVTPYDLDPRTNRRTQETPANSRTDIPTNPDPNMQTTAEDIGALLTMLYYCAENQGGALIAAFEDDITPEECAGILDLLSQNYIGSLIEEGVPPDTQVAHKHSWIGDTHSDAGIVYTNNGDYVVVMFLHQPNWLEWEVSSPLMADIARATYNYFNFDSPYLGQQLGDS